MECKQININIASFCVLLRRSIHTTFISLCLLFVTNNSSAMTVNDWGKDVDKEFVGTPCYSLDDVKIELNGYVRLSFKYHYNNCKNEVYFAETVPKNKIRGIEGINGSTAEVDFLILVEPDVKSLYIEMAGRYGYPSHRQFLLQKYIKAAKRENSGWQNAWKHSEQSLQEAASKDKSPPKIILLSPDVTQQRKTFRLDTYQIFVRGKAVDDAGVATVLVNGTKAGVKSDGSFAKKVKLAFGTNHMKVQAEDIHGNVAERTFTIIREEFIPDEVIADVDIPIKTRMNNPDGIGVVIGVESYQYVPAATYAYNDAEVMREYLADTLGFRKDRLKIVTNSRATSAEFDKLLGPNGWLARNTVKGKSDVVVYFSGHGIPDPKTKKVGLLPFDVDPNYSVGLPVDQMYATLGNLGARSVTIVLDACFSGQTRQKEMLIANARPVIITPKAEAVPSGITILSAASGAQISGAMKDKEHGLFTYYVLKGLGGAADGNKDGKLSMNELASFVAREVKTQSSRLGWEQTPQLQGDGGRVLVRW
jgi:hypothetical protein